MAGVLRPGSPEKLWPVVSAGSPGHCPLGKPLKTAEHHCCVEVAHLEMSTRFPSAVLLCCFRALSLFFAYTNHCAQECLVI